MTTTTTALQALTELLRDNQFPLSARNSELHDIIRDAIIARAALSAPAAQDVPSDTVQLFREALAWGMVYGPHIATERWDDMRDEMAASFAARASQPATPAAHPVHPVAGQADDPLQAEVECLTDESGTDYSVVVRGGGMRNANRSDVWMKRKPAEKLAAWVNDILRAAPTAPQAAHDERTELAMHRLGELLVKGLGPKHEALDDWARVMFALRAAAPQAPALVPLTDAMSAVESMSASRYKVVASDESMFWRHAVVAGDGQQQLYLGRETECKTMAAKFAGAFLDGAFAYQAALRGITPTTKEQQ